jgi:hypothetical protein
MWAVFPSGDQTVPSVLSGPLYLFATRSATDKLSGVLLILPTIVFVSLFLGKPTRLTALAAIAGVIWWFFWGLVVAAGVAA